MIIILKVVYFKLKLVVGYEMKMKLIIFLVAFFLICMVLVLISQESIFSAIFPNCHVKTISRDDLERINCFKSFFLLR